MCNEVRRLIALGQVREDFSEVRIPLRFPEGLPNLAPLESIRITDPNAIIRAVADAPGEAELVTRRWSWPGPGGRPVYNYRADDRQLGGRSGLGRCLVVVDGFYEFTAPTDPGKKRKDKWLFTLASENWFCLAGLWRREATVGEAYTLLTLPPGPDVTPYHSRSVVLVPREHWSEWLDPSIPSAEVLKPAPAGSFRIEQVG